MNDIDEIIENIGNLDVEEDILLACICLLHIYNDNKIDIKSLSRRLDTDTRTIKRLCKNWRDGGIIKRGKINKLGGWFDFDKDPSLVFVFDACVALGLTKRIC
ncbi:MAG: hypothetical protein GF411_08520 [Candidatus Lokiarchaeota archaeon]|nr:hypothetical protein [Candidatus Lokiarchaeota archaeon]